MKTQLHPSPCLFSASSADLPFHFFAGGRSVVLRRLGLEDAPALLAFFASHTSETIWQRYGYFPARMTPEHAARLVGVDQSRDAALGIFEDATVPARLIAIGRYCLAEDGQSAEVAFVVHEERRRLGLATLLLNTLAQIARVRGLRRLVASVQHDNPAMLTVFRRAGASFHSAEGTSGLDVTLALQKPTRLKARHSAAG